MQKQDRLVARKFFECVDSTFKVMTSNNKQAAVAAAVHWLFTSCDKTLLIRSLSKYYQRSAHFSPQFRQWIEISKWIFTYDEKFRLCHQMVGFSFLVFLHNLFVWWSFLFFQSLILFTSLDSSARRWMRAPFEYEVFLENDKILYFCQWRSECGNMLNYDLYP